MSKISEDILKYRPCKCVRLRIDKDIYRVYKYSAVKLESGKWSNNRGYLIGKIIPDEGFVPNKRYKKELAEEGNAYFKDSLTDISYGSYALIHCLTEDVLNKLKSYFLYETALQIYCYAVIMCINGFVHLDQIDEYYK